MLPRNAFRWRRSPAQRPANSPPSDGIRATSVGLLIITLGACTARVEPLPSDPAQPGAGPATSPGSGAPGTGAPGTGGPGSPAPGADPGSKPTPSTSDSFACDPSAVLATPPRVRRLTAEQWSNTIGALGLSASKPGLVNPFDDGLASGKFSSDVGSVSLPVESLSLLLDAAELLATDLLAVAKAESPCLAAAQPPRACLEEVFARLGTKAFRHPLASEEVTRYTDFALGQGASEGSDGALALAFSALLSSPSFAFRYEVGEGDADAAGRKRLGPYELASAISYTVADSPPDAALLADAAAGALSSPDQLRAHVLRLLDQAGGASSIKRFFVEYFRYPLAAGVFKDSDRFPFHNGLLLGDDTGRFIERALSSRKSFLETLFASPAGFAREETAASYGVEVAGPEPTWVTFPEGQRAGILTQPAFLVALSGNENTLPVHRGRFVSENVLCRPIPDIPLAEVPPLPSSEDDTVRERLAVHSTNPQCVTCHEQMDPFGLALEQYDHVGRYRVTGEGGKTIDASSVLTGAGAVDGPFTGPVELGQKLAQSPVVRQCFVLQGFRFWLGRDERSTDGCALRAADQAFEQSGGDPIEMFVSLLTSDAFLYRTASN